MDEEHGSDPSRRSSLSFALQRSHELTARFCLLELQFANAILDHADLTRGEVHHGQSVARARSVREGLVRILENLRPTRDEARIVESGLAELDRRLADEDAKDRRR
jgi:hypothetical protein